MDCAWLQYEVTSKICTSIHSRITLEDRGTNGGGLKNKREEIPGDKCCWRAVTGSVLAVAPVSHKERASRPFSAEPGDGFNLRLDNSTFSPARIGLRIAVGV